VATDLPAITRPWLRLQERGECRAEFVEDRPASDLTDDLVARIDAHTSVVAVGWVQYATGTTIDVPRLRRPPKRPASGSSSTPLRGLVRWGHLARRPHGAQRVQVARRAWRGSDRGARSRCHRPDTATAGVDGRPLPIRVRRHSDRGGEGARRFTQSTMSYLSVAGLTAAMGQLLAIGMDRSSNTRRDYATCCSVPSRTVAGCRSVVPPTPQPRRTSFHLDVQERTPRASSPDWVGRGSCAAFAVTG
jgi:selenocysteine lyase/cysteine desulfurase